RPTERSRRPREHLRLDVDPAGRSGTRCDGACAAISGRATRGRARNHAVDVGARSVVVAEPTDPPEPLWLVSRTDGFPANGRSTDLAVLRNVRGAGRQRLAAGQFPGGSAAGDRAPHVTHEHGPVAAG